MNDDTKIQNSSRPGLADWQPMPRPTDAEIVARAAADALRDGRYELGAVLAGVARQAHRAAYQTAARARGELFGSRTTDVPLVGQTRDEQPRTSSAPTCSHGYATRVNADGLVIHIGTNGVCEPSGTVLFDELADRVRDAANQDATAGWGDVEPGEPVDRPATGSRCVAQVGTPGGFYECHQGIAWAQGPDGVRAGWYHLDPEITDHEPVANGAH
jgi:hypothetical protein